MPRSLSGSMLEWTTCAVSYTHLLIPDIKKAVKKLEEYADIIVIEGAGSPAAVSYTHLDVYKRQL